MAAVWAANPSDSPHGQVAIYINGHLSQNDTICTVDACDMGKPLQMGGIVHLGQEADKPYGDFDEYQSLTGIVDELQHGESQYEDEKEAHDSTDESLESI